VAAVIFELDGGIVLVPSAQSSRVTASGRSRAGFVERGEVAESAAEREVLEETGLEVEVGPIIGLYSYEGQVPMIAVFARLA
jgi:NADH pyrophosphatase NudC (nudix superfamily)